MTTIEADAAKALLPDLTPEAELALLARVLFREGYDDHDVGHITYRQPDDTLLTVPVELGWNEVTASDIIRIDGDGNKLEGKWSAPPAILLHLEFHRVRPGVNVTVHQHPRFTTIWSAAGRMPPVYDQRAATLPDKDIVFYDDYRGVVEELEAARHAIGAMGNARCAILRNHGSFVVGDSIAQAYSNSMALEWRARQAWMAEAIGAANTVPEIGRSSIERTMARFNWTTPYSWEWAARRELGPVPPVLS